MPKLVRVTTVPLSLHVLLKGQMRYMGEHGFDVIMVSADGPELPEVLNDEKCEHVIVPMTRQITPLRDLSSLFKLVRLFKKLKPDIVHSHTPKAGLLAMMAAKFAGVKIRIHTIAGLRYVTTTGMRRRLLVNMEKLTAHYANHVWPNSKSLKQFILENKLVSSEKLEMIGEGSSNGINLERYTAAALDNTKLESIRQKINYNPDLFYFLSVGRIVKDKGMDELSLAFSRLYGKNSKLRLILVGSFEDDLDPVTESSRKILGEHPGIIRPGWSNEVEYYMHLSNALVHPSYREGFPNVILQAGAMNCPVICSGIDGNIDLVDHNVTGLICKVRDADSLYQQMEFALENPGVIEDRAINLRRKVEEKFDQKYVHQQILSRYKQLLE